MMLSPPSAKKLSSIADPLQPQHLGKQAAEDLLVRRARRPIAARRREVGRRQRPPVELAVGRARQPLQQHERRRHHVVRQARAEMRPQRRRIGARARGRHHIRRPAACCRPGPRARSPRTAPPPDAASAPPRSRPARSGSRGSSPARPPAPGSPAPRRRASAPGRRCGTSGSRPDHADRPRTAPPSAPPAPDSRAPAPRPQRRARPPPRPEQAAGPHPAHRPACCRSGRRWPERAAPASGALMVAHTVVSVGP